VAATILNCNFDRSATHSHTEIIGADRGLRHVMEAVRMVAAVDSAVLIHGETGTGKEIVARAIQERSARSSAPYVKVNCAAIPACLLESELFGHERGAFTGAFTQSTGRFQSADGGTLFLDEVGDLPLELQPKLLRILQEQEFERLGSSRTIRVNVRIITATNLDLAEMVRQRRFRADLFYRLNVFPIALPALRDRSEDIPLLARHFVRTFAARMGKEVSYIATGVMELLQQYEWPGNIRELQNVIERGVIRSSGQGLDIPPDELRAMAKPSIVKAGAGVLVRTLAEAERDHILEVLKEVGGVIAGRNGAAVRLGLPRTTLISRMQKLGIASTRAVSAVTNARVATDFGPQSAAAFAV
jgi:formate hydrogenlyase transcriptional activator